MYNVSVKYNRKKRIIAIHPKMSMLEFEAVCKHIFDIPYTRFFVIGGETRDYLVFIDCQTNNVIRISRMTEIGETLKEKNVVLLLRA
jgi:hypothetical protein